MNKRVSYPSKLIQRKQSFGGWPVWIQILALDANPRETGNFSMPQLLCVQNVDNTIKTGKCGLVFVPSHPNSFCYRRDVQEMFIKWMLMKINFLNPLLSFWPHSRCSKDHRDHHHHHDHQHQHSTVLPAFSMNSSSVIMGRFYRELHYISLCSRDSGSKSSLLTCSLCDLNEYN